VNGEHDEQQLAIKFRQALNRGADNLDSGVAERLFVARQKALAGHRSRVGGLALAGFSHLSSDALWHHARTALAVTALVFGAAGTYYWNDFQQADENEEIDSALLADDLPINAYLDQGFHAWLERSAPSTQE
jgi:hypothetical protein